VRSFTPIQKTFFRISTAGIASSWGYFVYMIVLYYDMRRDFWQGGETLNKE